MSYPGNKRSWHLSVLFRTTQFFIALLCRSLLWQFDHYLKSWVYCTLLLGEFEVYIGYTNQSQSYEMFEQITQDFIKFILQVLQSVL